MSIENNTTIPLQGDLLLTTQLELVAPTTVAGTLYGIAFMLFCLYVHALVPRLQNGDRKKQAKFMVAYSTLIMLCGLFSLVFNAWIIQDAYIQHNNYPGGPIEYMGSTQSFSPVVYVGFACQVAIDLLTLAIQIWRVWVIWSATRYVHFVVVLPVLGFLTLTGLKLRTIILESTLPIAEAVRLDSKTQLAAFAIQGTTIILCTLLISLYLMFKQWQQRRFIGKNQGSIKYMNIVAIIVESYALESGWLLVALTVWNRPIASLFSESIHYILIITYLLVQYRVARGQSYESQRGTNNISSLCWNRSNGSRTQSGQAGDIRGSSHVSAIADASQAPEISSMA